MINSKKYLPLPDSFWSAWACIIGIICASNVGTFIILIVCICISIYWIPKRYFLIPCLFFFLGGCRYIYYMHAYRGSSEILCTTSSKSLSGTALVTEIDYTQGKRYAYYMTLKILSLNHQKIPPCATIRLYVFSPPRVLVGDQINFHRLILNKSLPNSFKQYLFKEGIVTSAHVKNFSYRLLVRPYISIRRWCTQTRNSLSKNISQKLSSKTARLFTTLFLGGKQTYHLSTLRNYFSYWGIMHYLARSGLHVMILIGMWTFLLNYFAIPMTIRHIILCLYIVVYCALSWSSISFLRACMSWAFYQVLVSTGKPIRSLHVLAIITLIILLTNPLQLFYVDFQLSFGLTCALSWWQETYHQKRIHPDILK